VKYVAFIFILFLSACGSALVSNLPDTSSQPLPTPELLYTTDSANNIVKKGGWFSNDFRRGKSLRRKTMSGLTQDGRTITVISEGFGYPDGLVIQNAFGNLPMGDTFGAGRTNWGTEARGSESAHPYCISVLIHKAEPLTAETNNMLTRHGFMTTFCDADGDGVFETRVLGMNFGIPSWVK
jgi:hypothetical protein